MLVHPEITPPDNFYHFRDTTVYALRPVKVEKLGSFLAGKFRRLALPGITAITLFVLMSKIMNTPDGVIGQPWDPYFRDYAIYWFLQAMLVIFLVYGTLDPAFPKWRVV